MQAPPAASAPGAETRGATRVPAPDKTNPPPMPLAPPRRTVPAEARTAQLPPARRSSSRDILFGGVKIRVLAVDDDPDIINIMRHYLAETVEFLGAADGLEAAEKARRFLPDIFIIDWMIPKMSGIQLLEWLRQTSEFRKTPVIFLTAKGSTRDEQIARSKGANFYIQKPFDPRAISEALRQCTTLPGFTVRRERPSIAGVSPVAHKPGEDAVARVRANWAD